jgi:hypothetical protein
MLVFSFGAFSALSPLLAAAASIRNIPPTPHLAPIGTTPDDLKASIRFAVNEQGWNIISESPGVLRVSLRVRTHFAVVEIGFDSANYWIKYVDSTNLDYNPRGVKATKTRRAVQGPRIHRNYNKWVEQLATNIAIRTADSSKLKIPRTNPPANPLLIADELGKLDSLRERGVLTQAEFDRQKAKLLAQ